MSVSPQRATPTKVATDYSFSGKLDFDKFIKLYSDSFKGNPNYTDSTKKNLRELTGFIVNDPNIRDIRWIAYILATTLKETTNRVVLNTGKTNKAGHPITRSVWQFTWEPVEESGKGKVKRYGPEVKVERTTTGAVVTEQDGNQFDVESSGRFKARRSNKKQVVSVGASPSLKKPDDVYAKAAGVTKAYYGRGYVQLTWWNNYAVTGAKMGLGLDLLFNPDIMLTNRLLSYQMFSHCLRTGDGFANRHKLADYFNATKTDYVSARRMVNGNDHAAEIAGYARQFEAILLASRL
jgi:glycosyl hydrolase family 19 (putative chitinase)